MARLEFDEDVARLMEVLYRSRDIRRRRRLVHEALDARLGERMLDVGCGPGFYTAELLDQVGPDGFVVGVDASATMLAVAEHQCAGHANVAFHQADATSLPVPDRAVEGAVCVQVLEYVPDVGAALGEIYRALRPGGRAVLWDIDWATLSMHSADPARMERTLAAWDEHLHDPYLPRTLGARMRAAGFVDVTMAGHAFATMRMDPDTFGAGLLPLMERNVATVPAIGPEGARAWADEQRDLAATGEFYFACIQFCFKGIRPER